MVRAERPAAVNNDFDEAFAYLQKRLALPDKPSPSMVSVARRIHHASYSLIIWKFRLGKMPSRATAYIEEVGSDALQVLPQVLAGFSKTAKLLTRGIIENTLRHIYFYDHPIEYLKANQPGKWRVTVAAMFEALTSHPEFVETETQFDALGRLSSLYSELSAGVHGRALTDLETRTALVSLHYDDTKATEDALLLERCAAAANFLISIFHHERVSSFTGADRSLIMRTMPPKARQVWKDHSPSQALKSARA